MSIEPGVSELSWLDRPALTRYNISSANLLRTFKEFNAGKPYSEQFKPANFILTAHVDPLDVPVGCDPKRFQLIAPYTSNPALWLQIDWFNKYDPNEGPYRITGEEWDGDPTARPENLIKVQTYRDVMEAHPRHPEATFNDTHGNRCGPDTIGQLQPATIRVTSLAYLGKEGNLIHEVQSGITDASEATTEYRVPDRKTLFLDHAVPALSGLSAACLSRIIGADESHTAKILAGKRATAGFQEKLISVAVDIACDYFQANGISDTRADISRRIARKFWVQVLAHYNDVKQRAKACAATGCESPVSPRATYCGDACRKRHKRKQGL